jgi:hypothetical protein
VNLSEFGAGPRAFGDKDRREVFYTLFKALQTLYEIIGEHRIARICRYSAKTAPRGSSVGLQTPGRIGMAGSPV